jgi:hypothetical protein
VENRQILKAALVSRVPSRYLDGDYQHVILELSTILDIDKIRFEDGC